MIISQAGWKLWPFAHVITYGVIPVEQRLLWVDCIELIWVTILSTWVANKSVLVNIYVPLIQLLVDCSAVISIKLEVMIFLSFIILLFVNFLVWLKVFKWEIRSSDIRGNIWNNLQLFKKKSWGMTLRTVIFWFDCSFSDNVKKNSAISG